MAEKRIRMNRTSMTWIVLVIVVSTTLWCCQLSTSRFDKDILFDDITFRVPHDYKTITAHELTITDTNGQQHVLNMTYGKDGKGNLFRIMWETWSVPKDADPRIAFAAYDTNLSDNSKILPIENGRLVADKTGGRVIIPWWPESTTHKILIHYVAKLKTQQGNNIFHRTMVWYCNKTKRLVFASIESDHQDKDIDSDWAFFVAAVYCHHD